MTHPLSQSHLSKPKISFVALAAAAFGWPVVLTAATGSWVTKAPMPTARLEAAFGSINGQLFVAGGDDGTTSLNTHEGYDPISNTWSTKASMPTATHGAASAAINGRLYVAGGSSFATGCCFSTLEVYDPITDTWTTLASMPTPEANAAAANVNGKLYVAGGISQAVFGNPRNALLQVYDPVANTWATRTSMPTARAGAEGVEINGKLYVVGGTTNGTSSGYTGALEVYDPAMGTWTSKTPMPTPRQVFAAGVVNGLLYAIGGDPGGGFPQTAVNEVYDPTTDSWTTDAPMPTARYAVATGVINGTIYVVGGATGFGNGVPQKVNEAFTPTSGRAYSVDYYTNANTPGAPDATVRFINDGTLGDASPTGDLCAAIYVFDDAEQMQECCSCKITPNGYLALGVNPNLTSNNPPKTLHRGVIKVISSTPSPAAGLCDATSISKQPGIQGWMSHLQKTNPGFQFTEGELQDASLDAAELADLQEDCVVITQSNGITGMCSCADVGR